MAQEQPPPSFLVEWQEPPKEQGGFDRYLFSAATLNLLRTHYKEYPERFTFSETCTQDFAKSRTVWQIQFDGQPVGRAVCTVRHWHTSYELVYDQSVVTKQSSKRV